MFLTYSRAMPVEISWQHMRRNPSLDQTLEVAVETMLALIGRPHDWVHLLLCDDAAMKALNFRFRDKNTTTDVLSFPYLGAKIVSRTTRTYIGVEGALPGFDIAILGDIAISVPMARRQSSAYATSFEDELLFLLAHGLLHLLGLDHPDEDALRRMHARSDVLMRGAKSHLRSQKKKK